MLHRTALSVTIATVVAGGVLAPTTASATRRSATPKEVYAAPADGTYDLKGRGYGHGVGMSQYGAMRGAQAGHGALRVLRAYYPHTRVRGTGNPRLSVVLSADGQGYTRRSWPNAPFFRVAARSTLRVVDHRGSGLDRTATTPARIGGAKVRTWAVAVSGRQLWLRAYAGGAWRVGTLRDAKAGPVGAGTRGPLTFRAPSGPVVLRGLDGRTYPYRGNLRATVTSPGRIARLNVVRMESYLLGVVPAEMPALWPKAAVQAQAVAARTYAEHARRTNRGEAWDICDHYGCQVYSGRRGEHPAANRKIRSGSARGKVLTYHGSPITAMFGSSNGGWSIAAGPDYPYLPARKDRWDPQYRWTDRLRVSCIERAYGRSKSLRRLVVVDRDGQGAYGGRPGSVRFVFANGRTRTVTGSSPQGRDAAMRGLGRLCPGDGVGLRSSLFTLTNRPG